MTVVAVVRDDKEARQLCVLAKRLARAVEENLEVFWLVRNPGVLKRDLLPGDDLPEGLSPTLEDLCRLLAPPDGPPEEVADPPLSERPLVEPQVIVRILDRRRPLQAVLSAAAECGATYLLAVKRRERPRRGTSLARKLFTASPCHTILVRFGEGEEMPAGRPLRILAPSSGGPHASIALHVAERLASAEAGAVTALYVEPRAVDLAEEVGESVLREAMAEAGVAASRYVETQVVLDDDGLAAISQAAEGYDLLLLGASNVGGLRRLLFGTVPDRLLSGPHSMAVAVVRCRFSLAERLRRRLGRWLDLAVPQMSRQERIAVTERLQTGSVWSFDFMTLISLSTAIASFGLIQDSAAVVIGAMLVAPLMTPILGSGLALVQGNLPLLKNGARAILYGFLMALAVGFVIGRLVHLERLTEELLSRGGPTLLDMAVAFLSGLAAAYCLSRPGLLAALPGVAIAAALVPPIATTGISLAVGEMENMVGAALLFGTNVVAIILGAAVCLYAGGIRGRRGAGPSQSWVRLGFLGLLLGTVILAVPLRTQWLELLAAHRPVVSESTRSQLTTSLEGLEAEVVAVRRASRSVVEVVVYSAQPLPSDRARAIAQGVQNEIGDDTKVRLLTQLVVEP